MRSVLLAGAAALAVVMATFACSSSAPVTPTEEDAGPVARNDDPPPDDEPDPEPPPPIDDAGPTDDGGDEDGSPGGSTEGDAGALCQPDSIRESETNDTQATADPLAWKTGSFCGRLAGTDVDFMTFTIPSSQNGFQFSMSRAPNNNAYRVECSVDGQNFAFNGNYPYVIGKPYFCKMSLTGNQPADYRINLNVTAN
ncbi:MAG: hypothetical protein KF795_20520 [Labilithrix sp.]|nr:hypothetical protein [Labilithrix sp.]